MVTKKLIILLNLIVPYLGKRSELKKKGKCVEKVVIPISNCEKKWIGRR